MLASFLIVQTCRVNNALYQLVDALAGHLTAQLARLVYLAHHQELEGASPSLPLYSGSTISPPMRPFGT